MFSFVRVLLILIFLSSLSACNSSTSTSPSSDTHTPSGPPQASDSVAIFNGPMGNYTILKTESGYVVTDNVGSDGVRTLSNVEKLKFSDFTVNLTIRNKAAQVSTEDLESLIELYVAYFNRVPDADGLAYWIDQLIAGLTLDQIGASFYQAAIQFSSLTGYSASMTNADFVRVIYKNVLGRTDPDQEGLNYWTTALANGSETRGTLINKILSAAHSFKGDSNFGYVADLLDNKILVSKQFSVQQGLNYNTPEASISNGMSIASNITPTDTTTALNTLDKASTTTPTKSFTGNYSGSYSGSDFGSFTVQISASGSISGVATSMLYAGEKATISGAAVAGGSVNMKAMGSAGESSFAGSIDITSGTLAGTWKNSITGDSGTYTGKADVAPTSVKGTVSYGLTNNVKVTAYSIQNGVKSVAIGSSSTDGDGNYSIQLGGYTGSLLLETSGGTYIDPATGVKTELDAKFMSGVGSVNAGSSNIAHITPYTTVVINLAASRAGGIINNNIIASNGQVSNRLGLNPITTQPIDPSNPSSATAPTENRIYGSVLGGASQYGADNGGKPLPLILTDFTKLFQDDAFHLSPLVSTGFYNYTANDRNQTQLTRISASPAVLNTTWCCPPGTVCAIGCVAKRPEAAVCPISTSQLNGVCVKTISTTGGNSTPGGSTTGGTPTPLKSNEFNTKPTTNIICKAPSVIQNGVCVAPKTTGATEKDATACIKLGYKPSQYIGHDSQTLKNTCSQKINVRHCHSPSNRRGTRGGECGDEGKFFQYWSILNPGEVRDNLYMLPPGTTIHFAACVSPSMPVDDKGGYYHCSQ